MTDAGWIHAGIEAAKLAMADRDAHLTDPDSRDIPVARLLDPAYAAELAARIDPRRAAGPARATNPSGGGTVYLAVVDRDGNAVSLIQSNYTGRSGRACSIRTRGSSTRTAGATSASTPTHPNALAPGKRTLHTLLPGMLFRDGVAAPWVVAGSVGGDAQPQVHAQLVSALVDGGRRPARPPCRRRAGSSSRPRTSTRRSRSASNRATRPGSARRSKASATR